MRPVDADKLLASWKRMSLGRRDFDKVIMNSPTINVIPIQEGQWIKVENEDSSEAKYKCSECGYVGNDNTLNYCGKCGAHLTTL